MKNSLSYSRRPLLWGVKVDGRWMGRPFPSSEAADLEAEEIQQEAPWSVVEVDKMYGAAA